MSVIRTIVLFGSQITREAARNLLENQPEIRRVDSSSDSITLRILSDKSIEEISLIPLLAPSGISGFRLI